MGDFYNNVHPLNSFQGSMIKVIFKPYIWINTKQEIRYDPSKFS